MNFQKHRILDAARAGTRPLLIAQECAAPLSTVYSVISKARVNGADIPHFPTSKITRESGKTAPQQEIRFYIDAETAATLQAEALRRGFRPARLARNLITSICDDGLFTAVLEE